MVNARWPLLEADNLCVTFPFPAAFGGRSGSYTR